jgi:hypothetical protein
LKFSYFLNLYSAIGAGALALYLFPPIHKLIKQTKYKKAVTLLMIIIFISLTTFGVYEQITSASHSGINISPHEYMAHPVYQEFTAHVTNNFDYPIYDYSVTIMVKSGDLEVNKDLKFESAENDEKTNSKFPVKAFGLGGISHKYGLPYMELHFPEIEANSTKKYLVRISGEKYKKESLVEFAIGNYKTEPNPMFAIPMQLDKNGKFPKNLNLPESMRK